MNNLAADFIINLNNPIEAEFELGETEHFDCSFELFAAGTVWGSIDGDISNQTDLQNALNLKADRTDLDADVELINQTINENYNDLSGQITVNHNEITSLNQLVQSYGDIVTYDAADFATAAQGILANTALQPGDNITELVNNAGYITSADLPTLEDLTTQAQMNAINSGATSVNIAQIASNTQAISTETLNRQNADNGLQSQIDAIVASSDVFDIVGTYAELQAYDIATVPPNDIIKVLVDSTHNNAATYYRCVETGGVKSWSYIGSEGAYYTKSEADGRFVPLERTINGKALSNNITLDATDVGALPSSTIIPTVNNGTLTIQVNGTSVGTFTANQSGNTTANIVVPDRATWGNITGDIADQTDLQDALDDKQDVLSGGRYIEIVSGGTIATLPEGCKQVEYITATGTQHLDTLITATNDYEIRAKFRLTELNDSFLYGARQAYGVSSFALHKNYAPFSTDVGTGYVNLGVDSWYNVKQNKNGIYINDLLAHAYNNSLASFTTPNTIRVFAMAQGNNALYGTTFMKGDFASFEIYNNGVLVCNLVPCIDSNDVVCMYDTVNERFLYNLGTGNFIAGAEVVPSDTINCTLDGSDINTLLGYTPVNPSSLATVATSGDYDDLTNKPTIPTVGDGTITITQGGVTKGTFTTNQSANATIALDAGGGGGIQNTATGTDSLTILGTASTADYSVNIGINSEINADEGVAIGCEASAYSGVAIGRGAEVDSGGGVAIGISAEVSNNGDIAIGDYAGVNGTSAIALGYQASATASNAIQIGNGDNSDANTLQIGNYTLLDTSTGLIPDARLSSNICTTNTAQSISGRKTFLGEKAIYFKQSATTNKLGFTLYNPSDTELGAFEWRPSTIDGGALLNINVPYSSSNYVGFRYWGTAVNIIAPKVATAGNYYIPVNITDGTNTVTANANGTLNISSLLPTVPTNVSAFTNDSGYITGITSSDVTTALGYTPADNTLSNVSSIDSNSAVQTALNGKADTSLSNLSATGKTVIDGAFTNSFTNIISSDTSLKGSTALPKRIVVPNDGYTYEVIIRARVTTGTTSGNYVRLAVQGNKDDYNVYVCGCQTRSGSSVEAMGFSIVHVSYVASNATNFDIIRASGYNGNVNVIDAISYRRLGTNS